MVALLALIIDRRFGELRRGHPLVIFGKFAHWLEHKLNSGGRGALWRGGLAYLCAVLPALLLLWLLQGLAAQQSLLLGSLLEVAVLYFAIGWQSMREHVLPIARALAEGDLSSARQALSYIVSRDTDDLDAKQVLSATLETTLENSSDALFASLFWFAVAGPVGVLLHRLSNTLDAMWGYRSPRFILFGRVAARCDDLLNFIPAQLTACSFALVSGSWSALRCATSQGWRWKSINAGAVMAGGAGALGLILGGGASYQGQIQSRPRLGCGRAATSADVPRALALVERVCGLWLLLAFLVATVGVAW